jgi:multidrug efflux pump
MRLTRTAIRFRVSVVVLMLLTLLGGLWSYRALPKEANPSIEIPLVIVSTLFPGGSPEEIEALVTFPIERELQGVDGVAEIRSTSREGLSFIFVEFDTDVPLTEANQRVRERVDLARADLPAEAEEPLVREFNLEDLPILTVNLLAAYPLVQLTEVAERLRDELETVAGVLEAEVTGGAQREVQVNVDLTAMEAYGLTFEEIARAVEQENTSLPGGSIEVDRLRFQVRVDGRFEDAGRIADLVVRAPEQQPVYVRDVAEVVPLGFADRQSYSRVRELWREDERGRLVTSEVSDYEESVSLAVRARSGTNVLEIAGAVRRTIDQFPLPSSTRVVITADRSEEIALLVEEMENHIILGVVLVTFSLLFFLGLRAALVAALSIPLTMMLTFAVFLVLGEALNFIVLFALIVVIGILVDFSIVVVENIQRHAERGAGSWEAGRRAVAEVGWPVTAGLTTTMVVFLPLMFWEGVIGTYMRYLPLTLIITLTSALLVALAMVPVAAGYLLEEGGKAGEGGAAGAGGPAEGAAAKRRTGRVLRGIRAQPGRAAAMAAAAFLALVLALHNPITLLAVGLIAGGVWLLYRFLLAPGSRWFRERALPRLEGGYRSLLETALRRDYGVRHAHLRNVGALLALALGVAFLLLGGVLFLLLGRLPALAALVPGALLALLGLIGVLVHFLESLFLGGRWTLRAGIALGAVVLPFLLVRLAQGDLEARPLVALAALPALLLGVGALGAARGRRRRRLLLTDNRARVLHLALGGLLAVAGVYALAPTGGSFFPRTDPSQIRIDLEAPPGTGIEASNEVAERAVRRVEALLASDPAVRANLKAVLVNVGVTGGGPWRGTQPETERSRLTLDLVDYPLRAESSRETIRKVREAMDPFPGALVSVDEDRMGPPRGPPVEVEITGPEFQEVLAISLRAERRLREAIAAGEVEGLVDLRNTAEFGRPELLVRVDRERASIFGLSTAEVALNVRAAVEGRIAGTHREGEDEYDIRVRLREEDRQTLQSLEALALAAPDARVPLLALADFQETTGPGSITRVNLRPVVTLEGDLADGRTTGEVLGQVDRALRDLREGLTGGYTVRFAGEAEDRDEAFDFLGFALLLGVALMALVLITKFNSVVVPLIILTAVGLTMAGVVLQLIVTRTAFSIMTFLAVISLAGIVADDDIVMSEFILEYYERYRSRERAIVEGGVSRFRQVVLTAVTTIIGLVPLTLGFHLDFQGLFTALRPDFQIGSANTQFWGPLGAAVIAGLPVATLITLFVVPVTYSVVDSIGRRSAAWLGQPVERWTIGGAPAAAEEEEEEERRGEEGEAPAGGRAAPAGARRAGAPGRPLPGHRTRRRSAPRPGERGERPG